MKACGVQYLDTGATLSGCGRYRYDLSRVWVRGRPTAVFIAMNPSTADAATDDATIRKVVGFADRLGCGGLVVVNLCAFRARHPKDLYAAADPVGPDNDATILRLARAARGPVVAAWGAIPYHAKAPPAVRARPAAVRALLAGVPLKCLHLTAAGYPGHPLMLGYDRPLLTYPPRESSDG